MKDDRLYLHHMLERCRRITRFIRSGREAFMGSEELQDAVIRNLEVIGEAAKRVSVESRARMSSLDWKGICGMRDVLIHDYIGVTWTRSGMWHHSAFLNWKRRWRSFTRPREARALGRLGDTPTFKRTA